LRLFHGASVSLGVAGAAVLVSAAFGSTLGLLAGERGGALDAAVGRLVDLVLAFPGLLLAVALAAVLGPSAVNTVVALSVVGWVPYARLARSEARRVGSLDFVAAARASGARAVRILSRHLLPNVAAPLVVQATLHLAGAIMAESALSFLGLGVPPPAPSWGSMLAAGRTHVLDAPHVVLAPAAAILLVVLSTNVLGDALVDRLDRRVGSA
jgi:peptide/nickel transport system permease protein